MKRVANKPAERVTQAIHRALSYTSQPLVIALDGPSGSGKSTIANLMAKRFDAVVIPCDDFFAAEITDSGWDTKTPMERARDALDWRRLKREAIEPLLAGKVARWHAFDFQAETGEDGTYPMKAEVTELRPARVIVLEGAYSARPELSDLVDLKVFVDTPLEVRRRRLEYREESEFLSAWHARWDAAEEYYYAHIRPATSFDLVVSNPCDEA